MYLNKAILLFLVAVSLAATSCASVDLYSTEKDGYACQGNVMRFHQMYSDQDPQNILGETFTKALVDKQSPDAWIDFLSKMRTDYGKVVESKLAGLNHTGSDRGIRTLLLTYNTKFEKAERAEEFKCLVDSVNVRFDDYKVR